MSISLVPQFNYDSAFKVGALLLSAMQLTFRKGLGHIWFMVQNTCNRKGKVSKRINKNHNIGFVLFCFQYVLKKFWKTWCILQKFWMLIVLENHFCVSELHPKSSYGPGHEKILRNYTVILWPLIGFAAWRATWIVMEIIYQRH